MKSQLEIQLIQSYKAENITFLNNNPQYFTEAMELAISDKQPYAWRSAFLLFSCIKENDKRIKKHIPAIIDSMKNKKDGHQRELLKILYKMKLKSEFKVRILDICMNLWQDITKAPSVRITAFKFIVKIIIKQPADVSKIEYLTRGQYNESLSPGIKRAVQRIINQSD